MDSAHDNSIKAVLDKKTVSILMTDSGLGGLSICAEVVSRLHRQPLFQEAAITYFNAWPEQNRGYNKFDTITERIRIFDRALVGMAAYHPDLIMIACNTLSALYDRTEFSRHSEIPVLGIIDFGAVLIHEKLITTPGSKALILGTLTMIAENRHKESLIAKGIDADRIITRACDGLATAIEGRPDGEAVFELTDQYIREASSKIDPSRGTLFVALCCTHFGYIAPIIAEKVKQHVTEDVVILNPNTVMSEFLFERGNGAVGSKPNIDIKVVSKIVIDDIKIDSISRLIKDISPETAEALTNYEHIPDLFVF
jgi:glutamate racemase